MPHDHHSHAAPTAGESNANFRIAIALNVLIVVMQAVYGFIGHSIALLADAGHNLTDVLALLLAYGANVLAARPPTLRRTYGYRRTTILAALLNSVLLLVTTGAIIFGAIERFASPVPVDGEAVSIVAGIAIALNAISAWLFHKGHKHDLNVHAAFLHMAGDAAVSAGVVVAGIIIVYTGALWVDPAMSIIISIVILAGTWKILGESLNLASDAVPEQVDPAAIEAYLRSIECVQDVHDLHIWSMSTAHVVLTAHLVVPERMMEDSLLFHIASELHTHYGIEHTTLQVERGSLDCELAATDVI